MTLKTVSARWTRAVRIGAAAFFVLGFAGWAVAPSLAVDGARSAAQWPPSEFLGRWTGEGRLGFKDGKFESVTCRVTYIAEEAVKLKQTVRCATSGAKIEVLSTITETAGALSGTWTETVYDMKGDISGKRTDQGFRVQVTSDRLAANMDLLLIDDTQLVEIQFHDSTLLGLTLKLKKG